MSALLTAESISKIYGSGKDTFTAVGDVSFSVREEEFVSVVGPSGCGKTTLLKCLAGILSPTTGRALLNGEPITGPPDALAVVFQDYSNSLFPWLSVEKNVYLPISRKREIQSKRAAVDEALAAVGLADFGSKYPWQLSGGMQQRVAIARALAYQPKVLLMDEPFASVDAQTRGELEDLVLRVKDRYGITVVLVTHDIDEAVYMADTVVVLTGRPSTVREVVAVDLPYPRDQITTKELGAFGHLRAAVYRTVVPTRTSPGEQDQHDHDHDHDQDQDCEVAPAKSWNRT